jgi:kinesin family protein 3/17
MQGKKTPYELRGVIPNSLDHIFECVEAASAGQTFMVRCSYLEIYNEEIRDLLAADTMTKLELREDANKGVYVKDLTEVPTWTVEEVNSVSEELLIARVWYDSQVLCYRRWTEALTHELWRRQQ